MVRAQLILAALAACALPSCVDLNWSRASVYRPIPDDVAAAVEPGMTLDECLALLGAPIFVWEHDHDRIAVAWGGASNVGWGFSVSVPVTKDTSGSFSFDAASEDLLGVVAAFDDEDTVEWIRRGFLRELVPTGRKRPSAPSR